MAQQVTVPSQHLCRLPQEAAEQARVSWSGEQAGHPSCRFPGAGGWHRPSSTPRSPACRSPPSQPAVPENRKPRSARDTAAAHCHPSWGTRGWACKVWTPVGRSGAWALGQRPGVTTNLLRGLGSLTRSPRFHKCRCFRGGRRSESACRGSCCLPLPLSVFVAVKSKQHTFCVHSSAVLVRLRTRE